MQKCRAAPERNVWVRRTVESHLVRMREHVRVAVGRREEQDDDVAGRQLSTADVHWLQRDPLRHLDRAVESQQFLDSLLHRRVIARGHLVELATIADHSQHRVADDIGRGLVPREHEQDHRRDELAVVKRGAVVLRVDQGREQIVSRLPSAHLDELVEVGAELSSCDVGPSHPFTRPHRAGVQPHGQRRGMSHEQIVVAGGDAEQLADHPRGQRVGEVTHQLHTAAGEARLEQFVDDFLDPAGQRLDPPWRERLGDERPEARVIGRVPEEHEVGEQLVELAGRRGRGTFAPETIEPLEDSKLREIRLGLVAPEPGVPQRRRDVPVATEHRDAERTAVDRVESLEDAKRSMSASGGAAESPGTR